MMLNRPEKAPQRVETMTIHPPSEAESEALHSHIKNFQILSMKTDKNSIIEDVIGEAATCGATHKLYLAEQLDMDFKAVLNKHTPIRICKRKLVIMICSDYRQKRSRHGKKGAISKEDMPERHLARIEGISMHPVEDAAQNPYQLWKTVRNLLH